MIDVKKTYQLLLPIIIGSCAMKVSVIESTDVYQTRGAGFSQAVIFNGVMYGSGQVGWDKGFNLPTNPDFGNQFEQSLQNIERLLENQGCGWPDVLFLRFYVVDMDAAKRKQVSSFLQQTYTAGYTPATSLLGVSALARENLEIEIEFTAKLQDK